MSLLNPETIVLVTGGAGFIGSNLVEHLLEKKVRLRVLDNFSTGHEKNIAPFAHGLELHRGDLRDRNLMRKVLEGVKCVFHLAAFPSVPRSVKEPHLACEINILGSLILLDEARAAGVRRVVLSSSSSIYGESLEIPKRESAPASPLSPYAVSKLAMEHLGGVFAKLHSLEVVSLRYFNVYGPRQDSKSDYAAVIPSFLKAHLEKKPPTIFGDGEQTRDFTFVRDVVAANLQAAERPEVSGQVFNIAGGREISINALAAQIAKITGQVLPPKHEKPRLGDVLRSVAAIDQAQKGLQWEPATSLEKGLQETYHWFLKNGF
jgi:UDP-glucose 4-epimerase